MPESKLHLELRTALYLLLKLAFAESASIGCDQFVYWDPTDPRQCLAPDAFVRLGTPDHLFRVWKIWERGSPELGVEIVSESDPPWNQTLARYRQAGFSEVVRFDPTDLERPLAVWDRQGTELVERVLDDPLRARSVTLDHWWVVVPDPKLGAMLRLARDARGSELLPTAEELARRALNRP